MIFPAIATAQLFTIPAAPRPLSILEIVKLTSEYCDKFNQDCETALSYVLAGTDRHDVNPGPCDTFSTVVFTEGAYVWNHENKPEPEEEEAEAYNRADARIDYLESMCD